MKLKIKLMRSAGKIFLYISLLALTLASTLALAQYYPMYIPGIPSELNLHLDEKVLNEYQKKIASIAESKIPVIERRDKEYFPVKLSYKQHAREKDCFGKARINGDLKDHIDKVNLISSLTISLDNCYVGEVSKFRVLLPKTKNGSMEIFWSMLLESYGFPTLYTQAISLSVNGKIYKALFQERPSTAFLERYGIREAPILESAEQHLWIYNAREGYYKNILKTPNAEIGFFKSKPNPGEMEYEFAPQLGPRSTTASLDNREFIKNSPLKTQIAMRGASQYSSPNILNYEFYDALQKLFGKHGGGHNEKRIYIPMTNSFIPLYYDWMGVTYENLPDTAGYIKDPCTYTNGYPDSEFIKEYERRSGEKLSDQMMCTYAKVSNEYSHLSNWEDKLLFRRLGFEESPILYAQKKTENLYIQSGFRDTLLDFLMMRNGKYYLCRTSGDLQTCDQIKEKQAQKILGDGRYTAIDQYKILTTLIAGEVDAEIKSAGKEISNAGIYNIDVPVGMKYYINVAPGNGRDIRVHLGGIGSRGVVLGGLNESDKISVSGHAPNEYVDSRHDSLMLTGCLTFLNTVFNNPTLNSTATGCEDSINILHSEGNIREISIQNASEDALDIDFSKINIGSIDVNKAGNDCVDLSLGTYNIESALFSNCGDKAVSAGEYSKVDLKNVSIDHSKFGLISKDGSVISAEVVDFKNIGEKCMDSFIKKARYPVGHIHVLKHTCQIVKN